MRRPPDEEGGIVVNVHCYKWVNDVKIDCEGHCVSFRFNVYEMSSNSKLGN